jgi:hypothetical protein
LTIQSPQQVMASLSQFGKEDVSRMREQTVQDPELRIEMSSVDLQVQFVEQEQLLGEYQRLIAA